MCRDMTEKINFVATCLEWIQSIILLIIETFVLPNLMEDILDSEHLLSFVGPLQLFMCIIGFSENTATNKKGQL